VFRPYDIVHYHTLGPALFSFIPRSAGKKTAVTVQGLDWQRKKWGLFASAVLRLGEYAVVRFPNETMVVSRTLRSYYRERYRANTKFVANGTILRDRTPADRIRKYGLNPGTTFFSWEDSRPKRTAICWSKLLNSSTPL
jgi:hypothetical protein